MSAVTKDLIKQLVKEQQFGSTKEIMEAIKGMFQDVLQEALEAELEVQIGHERYKKTILITVEMVIPRKQLGVNLAISRLLFLEIEMENMNQNLFQNTVAV